MGKPFSDAEYARLVTLGDPGLAANSLEIAEYVQDMLQSLRKLTFHRKTKVLDFALVLAAEEAGRIVEASCRALPASDPDGRNRYLADSHHPNKRPRR